MQRENNATPRTDVSVQLADPDAVAEALPRLAELLVDAVESGASVNFMRGYSRQEAQHYWEKQLAAFRSGDRLWLLAKRGDTVVGMVMCLFAQQPNQPFRADIAKMIVHSSERRRGIGAMLMRAVEEAAFAAGRTTLVLDTGTGESGERLYRRMGWTEIGTVPNFAYAPDGRPAAATIFAKELAPPPPWRG